MKKFVSGLLFGKDTIFNGLVALGIVGAIARWLHLPKRPGQQRHIEQL